MQPQSDDELLAWLEAEYQRPFTGWDFSYISNRRTPLGSLPWNYEAIATHYLSEAHSVLDVDTGGGEVLSRLIAVSGFEGNGQALEPYWPNVAIARRNLEVHSVVVHDTSEHAATLGESSFDLILSRHGGSLSPKKLATLLKPNGHLVTEQIGDQTNQELRRLFGVQPEVQDAWPHNRSAAEEVFQHLDLAIVSLQSHRYTVRFADVGAVVYYLKAVPWEVPGFAIAKHAGSLLRLHRESMAKGYAIDTTYHAYLAIVAKH